MQIDPLTYGYSNARVKAMKSALLGRSTIDEMLFLDIRGIIGILEHTTYREDIVGLSMDYSGAELVELAMGKNFARTCRKVLEITPDKGKPTIKAFLERWDIHNLKLILLSKIVRGGAGIEVFLMPAGGLSEQLLHTLMEKESIEDVIYGLKGTKYRDILEPLWEEEGKRNIAVLLNGLDRHYYGNFTKAFREGGYERLVSSEVDAKNIMTVMRCKKAGLDEETMRGFIVDGGTFTGYEIAQMIEAKNIEEVVGKVRHRYDLTDALQDFRKDGMLSHFEIALERRLSMLGIKMLRLSVLSLGAIIGFLYLKEQEVANIRKIVRAKQYGIPREKLESMIVSLGS
ncbi:MAG: V-type ATPase subunit [Candidatus Micrarchaeia archaeon]